MSKTEKSVQEQLSKEYKPWQFKPGQSGNPAGRPVGSADPVKEIAERIANARIAMKLSAKQRRELAKMGVTDDNMTVLEHIIFDWATSSNVVKQDKFMERLAGKVPNKNVNQNQSNFDFMKYASKFTDSELEAIKGGADPLEILVAKLPDIEKDE